ncbi:ABC transporter ATP-binding protein [Streptomyces jeddahensis]|uniref:High-affinity branched-chain amino acid transport ATP-binding protein LivF n=1 Tax=Streptomyces jeddahensis TaxID=1716141 RepID=A0A177HRE3_9ACTN|nr:ABC transporter ATP-binding protein [Streptomyces jeddahensis]OAH13465.1 high-affinity branched-chain amino acid transport ATP-binding protein LivF [Streptomyces jeddahensis]
MRANKRERNTPVLAAEGIVAGYLPGVDVLRGCSIEVGPGELVGVIGPNGAGKSTLAKAVFGLLRVRAGTVRLNGEDVTGRPAHELVRRGVGYVPQLQNVFASLTVEENLRMGVYLRPRDYARRAAAVEELFPVLAARRRQKAGSMSGGERQMLAMARALMTEPQLLLLDEPSAGLSPLHQDHVFDRVREINGAGVAVLMVEQNARRCLQICHRGYVLDQGRNAYTGRGTDLLHDEKVIACYLGTLARAR